MERAREADADCGHRRPGQEDDFSIETSDALISF